MKYYLVLAGHLLANYFAFKLFNFLFSDFLTGCYLSFMNIVVFIWMLQLTFVLTKRRLLNDKADPKNKAVFITGCDTGFGNQLVRKLDAKGFHVFAGCLFPDGPGAQTLQKWCSQRLRVLPLDVTSDDSVRSAVKNVQDSLNGTKVDLWALVNNAGMHKGFSVELTDITEFKEVMDVNAFGPLRVSKAFLPLLRRTKGRIVNVTSIAGRACAPHVTPYFVSKYAAVAVNECLRQEMGVWGVSVVSIEPEMFQTQLTSTDGAKDRMQRTFSDVDEDVKSDYGEKYLRGFEKSMTDFVRYASPKIDLVVRDMELAVSLRYPANHYRPRRSLLFRFLLYCLVEFPSAIQDVCMDVVFFLLAFPKPEGLKKYR